MTVTTLTVMRVDPNSRDHGAARSPLYRAIRRITRNIAGIAFLCALVALVAAAAYAIT